MNYLLIINCSLKSLPKDSLLFIFLESSIYGASMEKCIPF